MLITIGAFDGFHKGHAELFECCSENSFKNNWSVISFYPHPSFLTHKLDASLFTLKERELIRNVLGIPEFYVIEFNESLKNLSPLEFWNSLKNKFKIDGIVMGSDFHFGKDRTGDAEYLKNLAISDGIKKVFIVSLFEKNKYSSSNIRKKIVSGDVKNAIEILGYPWFILSDVIHGNSRGRKLHFPTANLNIELNRTIPASGVYSAALIFDEKIYCSAVSIGNNPTFKDVNETRIEAFVMDFQGDLYEKEIAVFFLDKIRDIKIFHDEIELKNQIENDVENCRKVFENIMNKFEIKNFLDKAKIICQKKIKEPEIIRII